MFLFTDFFVYLDSQMSTPYIHPCCCVLRLEPDMMVGQDVWDLISGYIVGVMKKKWEVKREREDQVRGD